VGEEDGGMDTALGIPLYPAKGRSAIRICTEGGGSRYSALSDNGGRSKLLRVLLEGDVICH
jgi:hypothetical protein